MGDHSRRLALGMDLGVVCFDFVWAELKRVLRENFSECAHTLSSGRNYCESSALAR